MTPVDASPLLVLLVDDQPIIAEAIRLAFAAEPGLELHYCSQGEAALETAARVRPMVILQDLVMPGVEGIELVWSFRNQPITADVPIIVLSSRDEPGTKKRAFEAGATDYLVKLPDAIELRARISAHGRAYLHRRQRDEAYRALSESRQELSRLNVELVTANRKLAESKRQAARMPFTSCSASR